jgi:hypothetical protein
MRTVRNSSSWRTRLRRGAGVVGLISLTTVVAVAADNRDLLVVTSTNNNTANDVVVFKLDTAGMPSLSQVAIFPTGGKGGASGNGGAVQFAGDFGAVANYGSNNLTQLMRDGDSIMDAGTVPLAPGCLNPVSVALNQNHLFVAGANCAETHAWPSGRVDGAVVALPDASAGQIAVGQSWAAVTLKSGNGSVLQLPLTNDGDLTGSSFLVPLTLGSGATPLGAAFWGDILGFNPAHVADSFALLNKDRTVSAVPGPQPSYPSNAPCWLAKGRGNVWYSGNSPGQAISIFFSDGQGGVFYKSVPVPGVPTDLTVSRDGSWLAVIYTAATDNLARVAVFSIDTYGDLAQAATSQPVGGVAAFNGVAISQ